MFIYNYSILIFILFSIMLLCAGGAIWGLRTLKGAEGYSSYFSFSDKPSEIDIETKDTFLSTTDTLERYKNLFSYFAYGVNQFKTKKNERIQYPGVLSYQGFKVNGLEGFARSGLLLASWVSAGRNADVVLPDGKTFDIVTFLRNGILEGTSSQSPFYWGDIGDLDQRMVEAPDIARILWLTKKHIWDNFSEEQKKQVFSWLNQVNDKKSHDNNWHLFIVTTDIILSRLGYALNSNAYKHYEAFKKNYLEAGYFFDKPEGVDFYNTWGISYELFWIHYLDKTFDFSFLEEILPMAAHTTSHLISPIGFPIMGRSLCYRGAIPSPLLALSLLNPTDHNKGLARRALNITWSHFIEKGMLREGTVTQGYYEEDLRYVDNYSGAGSCGWSFRSLVLAFMHPDNDPFWDTPEVPLPVEQNDFVLDFPKLGWIIAGEKETQNISITIKNNTLSEATAEDAPLHKKILSWLSHRPMRPGNHAIKYDLHKYEARNPFPDYKENNSTSKVEEND